MTGYTIPVKKKQIQHRLCNISNVSTVQFSKSENNAYCKVNNNKWLKNSIEPFSSKKKLPAINVCMIVTNAK